MWTIFQTKTVTSILLAVVSLIDAQTPPFQFGNGTLDVFIYPNLNGGSGVVDLPKPMAYLDSLAKSFQQATNGYVTFFDDSGPSIGYIDIYYMSLDTRNEGVGKNEVWYRAGNSSGDLSSARDIIAGTGTLFAPQAIIVATWYKVEAFERRAGQQNTFQLAIPYSDTGETWAIFAYPQLQFYESANSNIATAGITNATFAEVKSVARVNSTLAMNELSSGTNCNRTGIYAHRINQGRPTSAPTVVPSKSPIKAPTSAKCGLFGWSIFCPFTLCGIFGRWLGLCQND